jgi:hypothetical protein
LFEFLYYIKKKLLSEINEILKQFMIEKIERAGNYKIIKKEIDLTKLRSKMKHICGYIKDKEAIESYFWDKALLGIKKINDKIIFVIEPNKEIHNNFFECKPVIDNYVI